jgi:hypothetical protein
MRFLYVFFFLFILFFNDLLHARRELPVTYTKNITIDRTSNYSAHGYSVYNAYASYNPVSRRDSELASLSSGRTDSDTMSISSMSA